MCLSRSSVFSRSGGLRPGEGLDRPVALGNIGTQHECHLLVSDDERHDRRKEPLAGTRDVDLDLASLLGIALGCLGGVQALDSPHQVLREDRGGGLPDDPVALNAEETRCGLAGVNHHAASVYQKGWHEGLLEQAFS